MQKRDVDPNEGKEIIQIVDKHDNDVSMKERSDSKGKQIERNETPETDPDETCVTVEKTEISPPAMSEYEYPSLVGTSHIKDDEVVTRSAQLENDSKGKSEEKPPSLEQFVTPASPDTKGAIYRSFATFVRNSRTSDQSSSGVSSTASVTLSNDSSFVHAPPHEKSQNHDRSRTTDSERTPSKEKSQSTQSHERPDRDSSPPSRSPKRHRSRFPLRISKCVPPTFRNIYRPNVTPRTLLHNVTRVHLFLHP